MPQEQAKHKELLENIHNIQDKLTDMSDKNFLNDEAFRQLSKTNKEAYDKIEGLLRGISTITLAYNETITRSRWVKQYDADYHKRQSQKKGDKLSNPGKYFKCSCGEMLSKGGSHHFFTSRAGRDHLKTAKHADALMRINYDKKGFAKNKHFGIAKMLFLNSHINYKRYNHKGTKMTDKLRRIPKRSIYPVFYTIEQAIKSYKVGKCSDYVDDCECCMEEKVLLRTEQFGYMCKECVSVLEDDP